MTFNRSILKQPDRSLEQRIYRIMGENIVDGLTKAYNIILNYEHHGYDMNKIKANYVRFCNMLAKEHEEACRKRRENTP